MNRTVDGGLSDRITVDPLVGVMDLVGGRAVHAVAGDRDAYRPVSFCDGSPYALVAHYQRLGVSDLYLADLDAIGGGPIQRDAIAKVAEQVGTRDLLVDAGVSADECSELLADRHSLACDFPGIRWVIATETCRTIGTLNRVACEVGGDRVILGLDYRNGGFLSDDLSEQDWIRAAERIGCRDVIVLDVSRVGTGAGPMTGPACRRVKQAAPSMQIFSGGGIRSQEDIEALQSAGCDRFLVATMLYP